MKQKNHETAFYFYQIKLENQRVYRDQVSNPALFLPFFPLFQGDFLFILGWFILSYLFSLLLLEIVFQWA